MIQTFALGQQDFLLDGKPFQIISGEMHPARIPAPYWRHRIRTAKAMGCNTIACYVFWNYHEAREGQYDFTSEGRDIVQFVRICQEEGLWVLMRPGPYVCAEWEFGGLPPYLLRDPELRIRCLSPRYMAAAERYLRALARVLRPLQVSAGGPILMFQIENEYGSYANDRAYLERLRQIWQEEGIAGPFFNSDEPTPAVMEAGSLPGEAIGLNPGAGEAEFEVAHRVRPGVPAFSAESYPGWLTHWGENWARPDFPKFLQEIQGLLERKRSFNFYVIHGGTNFGFTAGANSGSKGYEPHVTSYDYDAPIDEQGRPTHKYQALRDLVARYTGPAPAIPEPIPAMAVPPIALRPYASLWSNLPAPISSVQPRPMEMYGQDYGFIAYETTLVGHKSGKLAIFDLHDYATVFADGKYVGKLDRREAEKTIDLPPAEVLTILVEGMGRINYAEFMVDRKGITDHVSLNGMTLMNWRVYPLPMSEDFIRTLPDGQAGSRPGIFFRGEFDLPQTADTFFDLSGYKKGLVWVNGHNLGRFWDIGPQKRLYCPANWLVKGRNQITVFDLHQLQPAPIAGLS